MRITRLLSRGIRVRGVDVRETYDPVVGRMKDILVDVGRGMVTTMLLASLSNQPIGNLCHVFSKW